MSSDARIVETLNRQRAAAEKFLKDTVGCLIVDNSVPHIRRAIADEIEMVYLHGERQSFVKVNDYDLSHTLAGFQFRYQDERDFPVSLLMFKPRMLPLGEDIPMSREEEHLMRAGVVLQMQSDNTSTHIESGQRESNSALAMHYTEDRLVLSIGEVSLSEIATGFMVEVDVATGIVHGSFGMKFG